MINLNIYYNYKSKDMTEDQLIVATAMLDL